MADNKIVYRTADSLPIMGEVTEMTHALVEDDGQLKRVPGNMLGGGKTAIIYVDIGSDEESSPSPMSLRNFMSGASTYTSSSPDVYFPCTCDNMTFEEARDIILSGKKLDVVEIMNVENGIQVHFSPVMMEYISEDEVIILYDIYGLMSSHIPIIWTAEGITYGDPSSEDGGGK